MNGSIRMKKDKKKIFIISSSRAEYGLLRNLIKKIYKSKNLKFHLSITGTHLSSVHGKTIKEVKKDAPIINSQAKILNFNDDSIGISKSFSLGVVKFSKLFKKYKPNLILVLGDKFEIFSSVVAGTFSRIPIAHIHGGEETVGAIDNFIRHSITKMSHIHFTSALEHKNRVVQMGENPKNVFNVGALGLEDIKNFKFKSKDYLKEKYNIDFKKKTILVCLHPVSLEPNTEKSNIKQILAAVEPLDNINIIFTSPNADHGFRIIDKEINTFVKKRQNCFYIRSFGRDDYFSCLKFSSLILGNSSSGIIEAPSFKTFSINLGSRQKGRIRANSVIDCEIHKDKIRKLLNKYLNKRVETNGNCFYNPYFKEDSSKKILKILEKINLNKIIKKPFFNKI